jgi:acetyl esterase/lipase
VRTSIHLRRLACFLLPALAPLTAAEPLVLNLWPGQPPGDTLVLPPEADRTKETDKLIAGRRIIKLGNVSVPQLAVHRPPAKRDTGAAVVICPGGGFSILAYDLEGTEVAAWLNSIGVTGIVLKYRVPVRDPARRWLAPVQDAQRAMSLVRSRAAEWGLDPARIGIIGFSAGGATAAYTSLLLEERRYEALDGADRFPCRPDFTMLIYTGGFVERGQTTLALPSGLVMRKEAPPMFFVHAFDDGVPVQNALLAAAELKRVGGEAELHVYDTGGHGYGLRPVAGQPVTTWPARAEAWLARRGLLAARR